MVASRKNRMSTIQGGRPRVAEEPGEHAFGVGGGSGVAAA